MQLTSRDLISAGMYLRIVTQTSTLSLLDVFILETSGLKIKSLEEWLQIKLFQFAFNCIKRFSI